MDKQTVTIYNEQTKYVLDEMTLVELEAMHEQFGTEFVLGDGHIQEIID